jgi:glycosyltransferase involved in cell wall biosynthesis
MKIGFDAKRYFRNPTGLGNYSRTLIGNLVGYYPENDYRLYAAISDRTAASIPSFENDRVTIRTAPPFWNGAITAGLWRSLRLSAEVQRDGLDIFHGLSNEIPAGIDVASKTRFVVTIHDLIFLSHPQFYHRSERAIYHWKCRSACRRADAVVAVSEQTRREIIDRFQIPPSRIRVVYQSCDPRFGVPIAAESLGQLRRQYRLPSDFILYVGSLSERKNARGLIEALQILKDRMPVPLVLVGKGKQYATRLRERIEHHKLTRQVQFFSDIPSCDLPGLYQLASAFVYPSFQEGFGIPIIEALHSRVPVITSAGGCFSEAGGPSSRYIDPFDPASIANAIETVLTDRRLAEQMIEDGAAHVQRFAPRRTTDTLWRLYQELMS